MKKLTKSNDKVISGVLGGIGEYLGVDPTFIRVIYAIGIFMSVGGLIPLYIILAIFMPSQYESGNSSYRYQQRPYREDTYREKNPYRENDYSYYEDSYKKKSRKEVTPRDDEDWSDF